MVPGSPADRARLQPYKVITRVNGQPVATPAAFYRAMDTAGKKVVLSVLDFGGMNEEKFTVEKD